MTVLVVTGLSGGGRSTALRALEDLGFFCVDNLPPTLAPQLLKLVADDAKPSGVGLGIDVRTGAFLKGAEQVLAELEAKGHRVEVLFLDCTDEVLVRRFSETRRPHVLAHEGDLLSAIGNERQRLAWLRQRANRVIDTTELTVHDLKHLLAEQVSRTDGSAQMVTRIVSFGFKYGLPVDADLVFDLRFLPNPYFVDSLRGLSGTDAEVSDYVLSAEVTEEFLQTLWPLLEKTLPRYAQEGKAYLTIGFGCTGGRHRSVAVAEHAAQKLGERFDVALSHRDVGKFKG